MVFIWGSGVMASSSSRNDHAVERHHAALEDGQGIELDLADLILEVDHEFR
jgi:hypothetical protein